MFGEVKRNTAPARTSRYTLQASIVALQEFISPPRFQARQEKCLAAETEEARVSQRIQPRSKVSSSSVVPRLLLLTVLLVLVLAGW